MQRELELYTRAIRAAARFPEQSDHSICALLIAETFKVDVNIVLDAIGRERRGEWKPATGGSQ